MVALNIRFIFHLFSGQRRDHDFQHEVETLQRQHDNFPGSVLVLSIDIVLHPQLGDLTDPQAIALWQDLIILGVVVFAMAGPPCETWSPGRHSKPESDGSHSPRPLRTQDQLWGLTCLRKSEASSISVGNALLRATIRMFFCSSTKSHSCSCHGSSLKARLVATNSELMVGA